MPKATCSVDGCDRTEWATALCGMHYQRKRLTGSVSRSPGPTVEERFWAKVDKGGPVSEYRPDLGPCWIWTACIMPTGYGFWSHGYPHAVKTTSHRYSYGQTKGTVPEGLHIDHLCRVRACCNPEHLEAVTPQENARRTRRPTCGRGHAMTEANVYSGPAGTYRQCLTCMTLRNRKQLG